MRTISKLILCSLASLSLIGCGGETDSRVPTKALSKSDNSKAFPVEAQPGQSDPAAVETVKKIVAAHTGNNPSLLEKLKGVSLQREGRFTINVPELFGKAVKYEFQGSWPDRGKYTWSGQVNAIFRIVDQSAFQDINGAPQPRFDDELTGHLYSDWLQLLLPLSEEGSTFAPGPTFTLEQTTYPSIRIWRLGKPQAIFYYDAQKMLVTRIAYEGKDMGAKAFFELSMSEHKPFDGIMLATKVYVRKDGQEFIEYDKLTVEMGKQHPLKLFAEP
jgi:hypothetical protein